MSYKPNVVIFDPSYAVVLENAIMDGEYKDDLRKNSNVIHGDISDKLCRLEELVVDENCRKFYDWNRVQILIQGINLKLNEFESNPKLLDSHIQNYIGTLCEIYTISQRDTHGSQKLVNGVGSILYTIAKVRGFSIVTNYFSSDVYLIPGIVDRLEESKEENETFILLMWLSNLVFVPFQLNRISQGLPITILKISIDKLERHVNASKNQLAASMVVSRLLSRQEILDEGVLDIYFSDILLPRWSSSDPDRKALKLGHLITINKILKACPHRHLQDFIKSTHDLLNSDLRYVEYCISNSLIYNFSALEMFYTIKILGKITCINLSYGLFDEAADGINMLLYGIMGLLVNRFDSDLRYAMAKSLSGICVELSKTAVNYQEQLTVHMVRQLSIENIDMESSLITNSNQTFYVFRPDLHIDFDDISISKYHTILLFMGFISLKKALIPSLIPLFFTIIHKTLFFKQMRQSAILGGSLRDSSCFILWSITRALDKRTFDSLCTADLTMMKHIFLDMIRVVVFDPDFIIRRCGIAVLQEFTGRYGSIFFEHIGIRKEDVGPFTMKFIELFDYSKISTVSQAYSIVESLMELNIEKAIFIHYLKQNILDEDTSYESKNSSTQLLKICFAYDQSSSNISFSDFKEPSVSELVEELLNRNANVSLIMDLLPLVNKQENLMDQVRLIFVDSNSSKIMDTSDMAYAYIKWLLFLTYNDSYISKEEWSKVFNISRIYNSPEIKDSTMNFLKAIKRDVLENYPEFANQIIASISKNNEVISGSAFHYSYFNDDERKSIWNLLLGTSLKSETKENLLNCLNNLDYNFPHDDNSINGIVSLLDDYTITVQGDVGSKVRFAALSLIENNLSLFSSNQQYLREKLIRISGEVIDKLRTKSFKILMDLEKNSLKSELNEGSVDEYFERLFSFYEMKLLDSDETNTQLALCFWRGVCFSMASSSARSTLRNTAFAKFVKFLSNLSEYRQKEILSMFLKVLVKSSGRESAMVKQREHKTIDAQLNLLLKIFESGVPLPKNFNYKLLYVRCYNLHLKSNMLRLGLVLRIFMFISSESYIPRDTQLEARKRVLYLAFKHQKSQVRCMALEVLYQIVDNLDSKNRALTDLERIDCEQSTDKLQIYFSQFEALLSDI